MARTPVPVEAVAHACNAVISYQPFNGDLSGMLYRDGRRSVIGVNSNHAAVRQRFTIAHELGHLLLHGGHDIWVDRLVRINLRDAESSNATNLEEIQANAFAAELLMPRDIVIREVLNQVENHQFHDTRQLGMQLSHRFHVSVSAMQYRLINLGILDPEPSVS
jgi:Zn-dependent peptidase ImmA (M78 family)